MRVKGVLPNITMVFLIEWTVNAYTQQSHWLKENHTILMKASPCEAVWESIKQYKLSLLLYIIIMNSIMECYVLLFHKSPEFSPGTQLFLLFA